MAQHARADVPSPQGSTTVARAAAASLEWLPWSGCIRIVIGAPMSFAEDADYNHTASQLRERVEQMWSRM